MSGYIDTRTLMYKHVLSIDAAEGRVASADGKLRLAAHLGVLLFYGRDNLRNHSDIGVFIDRHLSDHGA